MVNARIAIRWVAGSAITRTMRPPAPLIGDLRVTCETQVAVSVSPSKPWLENPMQKIRGVGFTLSTVFEAALAAGLDAMDADGVDVIVTSSFDETVRELTGSSGYNSTDRGTGGVPARTLQLRAGEVVVVNGPLATDEGLDPTRLMAHEAGHVLIYRRGDTSHRIWMSRIESQGDYTLYARGALALEEARIERAVINRGFQPFDWLEPSNLTEILRETQRVVDGARRSENASGVDAKFALLTKALGYVGAAATTGIPLPLGDLGRGARQTWDSFVAPTWDARVELYASVPDATSKNDRKDWFQTLLLAGELERLMLSAAGFELRPDGTCVKQ